MDQILFDTSKNGKTKHTQLQIINGFIELLGQYPHDKPTVKSILHAAGVTRSTFYTYFDSVDDLFQYVTDEIVRCAEEYLLAIDGEARLVEMLMKWFEFCRANSRLYVALSDAKDSRFTLAMTDVWKRHLTVMMDHDSVPNDMFRTMHFVYIPRSNEYMTYAWLTEPELKCMPAKVLAQIINNQRLNYVSRTSVQGHAPRRPGFSNKPEFICSEVVSIARMQELMHTGREKFLHDNFTDEEILQAEKSSISIYFYGQFYAAKRAITYCICRRVDEKLFKNISIVIYSNQAEEMASVSLSGHAATLAEESNINTIRLCTSYESDYAAAFVITTM